MAAASMKRAGNVSDIEARAMLTRAVFQGLAQNFENVAWELRQFVEKEQAVVGERNFAGARDDSAADQSGVGDGVVRRAIRARSHQACALDRGLRRRCESWSSPELLRR